MALANVTMQAVAWQGNPYQMAVVDIPIPTLRMETDAIVRVTTAAICGSDLHVYHGAFGSENAPWTMGHEGVGIVEVIGNSVTGISVGDHVIIPDNCPSGHTYMGPGEPPSISFGLGDDFGEGMGGTQAEYVRVPFASDSLIPIPFNGITNGTVPNELDYLLIGDIFGTAWAGVTWSGFEPGDSLVVFGAGPVGMLAAYSAVLRGASRVYIVDHEPTRLQRAASIGAIPINFRDSDPVEQILAREPDGVARAVDCVGYEAVNENLEPEENVILRHMVAVLANGGGIGGIGIYNSQRNSSGVPLGAKYPPLIGFPVAEFFGKRLTWRAGGVNIREIAPELVQLVASGIAKPGFVFSRTIGIEEAPEYYRRFDQHEETKVAISFV